MSRIGKNPIEVPTGVTVEITGNKVVAKGPKGELSRELPETMKITMEGNTITVKRPDDTIKSKSLHGLTRSLVANMVTGVHTGFTKQLEIIGVGYRANANNNKITLNLGFSHPIELTAPQTITITQDEKNKNLITISGANKEEVGETAAKIRSYKKPEPYKGKGIRYVGEQVQRKAGKAAGAK